MAWQSTLALVLSFSAAMLFALLAIGPTGFQFFEAGQELIVGPIIGLGALIIAASPFFKDTKRTKLNVASLVVATIIFALWTMLTLVFYFAYGNCPGGVC